MFNIRKANVNDARYLGILAVSTIRDELHQWLDPETFPLNDQIEVKNRSFARSLRCAGEDDVHLVACEGERIVGYCNYRVVPATRSYHERVYRWIDWLLDATIYRRQLALRRLDRYQALGAAERPLIEEHLNVHRFVYVSSTCIDSSCQGKGLGSQFVKAAIEFARARQLDIFLEATPDGARLYKKFGFKVLCECKVANISFPLMLWTT